MTGRIVSTVLSLFLLASCNFLQGDEVVAKVGTRMLYRSEVEKYIPEGSAPEDSAALAQKFIRSWALDLLFEKEASDKLHGEMKEINQEVREYRNELLKYRYEQAFLDARMDTEVTDEEVEQYHKLHLKELTLDRPILKVRFLDILEDAPQKAEMMKLMSSSDYEEFSQMDSLSQLYAIRYFDSSDQWMDSMVLAREFGTDYSTMLAEKSGSWIRMLSPERVDERIAYVVDICWKGPAPVEYCEDEIRDNILIGRKRDLQEVLEQDLLGNALAQKKLVIY